WNDWWEFQTQYYLTYFDDTGQEHEIGVVKIGQFGMVETQSRPNIPETFEALDDHFFSVGQSENYYINLNSLNDEARVEILSGLQDLAFKSERLDSTLEERVMERSLLRSVDISQIRGRFRRLAAGDARLTPYRFAYKTPVNLNLNEITPVLSFD